MRSEDKKEKKSHRERVDLDNFKKKNCHKEWVGEEKKKHEEGVRSDRKKQNHMEKMESEE